MKISPRELDKFTMEEVLIVNSIFDMKEDYDTAKSGYDLYVAERQSSK